MAFQIREGMWLRLDKKARKKKRRAYVSFMDLEMSYIKSNRDAF